MRKILIAAAAFAVLAIGPAMGADMPIPYGSPPPIPVYNWTGFYAGLHVGGGWDRTDWFEDATLSGAGGVAPTGFHDAAVSASGFLGGGQAGFNYQTGLTVWGIQADGGWASITGSAGCFFEVVGTAQTCGQTVDYLGTITGRVGATYSSFLFYLLGGAAWEHEQISNTCIGCGPPPTLTFSGVAWGWTVGVGVEYAMPMGWSAFLQYNFIDFDTRDLSFGGIFSENIRENLNILKFGFNYRFGWEAGLPR
jgi:outer membrane immunogenic protein